MAPLGLATVAALTPEDVEVDIWDEGVQGLIDETTRLSKQYDLFGVTGFENHIERVRELSRVLRARGALTAVGGPGVSGAPELYRDLYDVLFIGEAERTWPRFIEEWRAGRHRAEYRQVEKIDVGDSPRPRWDGVDLSSYLVGAVQTTRGCPFDCEFCDVIYIYGRRPRHKTVEQVVEEVRELERRGAQNVFLCDDNLIGDPGFAKALLAELAKLNRTLRHPLGFFTQLSLNVAKDDELLELLVQANFVWLFIGIESPNVESLVEANKPQNYRTDIVSDVRKIQSYGIPVTGGMIVGFDHDDVTIFDEQLAFLQEAGIPNPQLNILYAAKGTKLWTRLHKEGRVLSFRDQSLTAGVGSAFGLPNIVPKRMTRVELLSGYLELARLVRNWSSFESRVLTMLSGLRSATSPTGLGRRPVPLRVLLRAVKLFLFGMDREARATTLRLIRETRRRAPWMMPRVTRFIAMQYLLQRSLPQLEQIVEEHLRLERQGGLPREETVFFIPDGFEKPFKRVFPELYHRVLDGLHAKERVQDALMEVTYDFLTRWGATFETFEEHHREYLLELCDRTVAKDNRDAPESEGVRVAPPETLESAADARRNEMLLRQLAQDVLTGVGRDLRTFRPEEELVVERGA